MSKTKKLHSGKAFSYINAIIALSKIDGSGADIKTLAIDLSNMLTKQMEAHGDYITDESAFLNLEWHDLKKNPNDIPQDGEKLLLQGKDGNIYTGRYCPLQTRAPFAVENIKYSDGLAIYTAEFCVKEMFIKWCDFSKLEERY